MKTGHCDFQNRPLDSETGQYLWIEARHEEKADSPEEGLALMARYRLLPCPFCGKSPIAFGSGERQRGLMIECATEGCVGPHVSYYDRETAVLRWNHRASGEPSWIDDDQIAATSPL